MSGIESMALEDAFRLTTKMEVALISGVLQVRIEHESSVIRLLIDAGIPTMVVGSEWSSWGRHTLFSKSTFILITIGALVDLAYQLNGFGDDRIQSLGPESSDE